MPPKIFYQSSMPRAGSTLLQNILAQNPSFYVTPTSGLLELIFGARLNYTNTLDFSTRLSLVNQPLLRVNPSPRPPAPAASISRSWQGHEIFPPRGKDKKGLFPQP